jgi:hypothetical protein
MSAKASRARIEIQLKIPNQEGLAGEALGGKIQKRLLLLP